MKYENNEQAAKLLDLAMDLEKEGKTKEAIEVYLETIKAAPLWATPYYNVGLMYKYQGDWHNSLNYNEMAVQLDPTDKPSIWNWAIAATALKDWRTARKAWRKFGIPVPFGDENAEIRMKIGSTPVRLKTNREVVWVTRIDPARAIIDNVPTAESKRRYKDIILNDGAPNGMRTYDGHDFPVFDELELFEKSGYATFSAWVSVLRPQSLESLEKTLEEKDCGFENWTKTIRYVCKQCSEGKPHEHHDKALPKQVETGHYLLGLAAKNEMDLRHIIRTWALQTRSDILEFEKIL
jgi:tetratricopeptide (TPR) repeat protein